MVTQPAVERDEVPRPRLKLDGSVTPVRFLFSAASEYLCVQKERNVLHWLQKELVWEDVVEISILKLKMDLQGPQMEVGIVQIGQDPRSRDHGFVCSAAV
jgi:hypothetical protein